MNFIKDKLKELFRCRELLRIKVKYNPNTDHLKSGYFEIKADKPKFDTITEIYNKRTCNIVYT